MPATPADPFLLSILVIAAGLFHRAHGNPPPFRAAKYLESTFIMFFNYLFLLINILGDTCSLGEASDTARHRDLNSPANTP
jgi:hypothetical protein